MTMKLKYYLLGIFTLLFGFVSFTNAGYVFKFNQTYPGPFDANYDINVFGKGIPLTSSLGYSKKMLYITNGRYMFWQENQLPYVYSNGIYGQINFYKVCPSLGGEGNPFGTSSCSSYPCSINYGQTNCSQTNISNAEETKNIIGNFFNTLNQSSDYYYIHYVNNLTMFCFYSSSLDKIMCFFQPSSSNGTNYGSSFDGISSSLLFNPPSYSPTGGDSGNSSSSSGNHSMYSNNQSVYNSLYSQGYRPQLCYGGFDIDNLFGTGDSSFSDIKAGYGATVFDLYSSYSGNSDFISWYDNNYLDYVYLKEFQDAPEYLNYIGKSKGLVGLGIVRDSYFKGDSFNTSNYKYFCDLVFNFGGSLDLGSSPISIIDSSLSEQLIGEIAGSIDILIPTSGSALSFMVQSMCDNGTLDGYLCDTSSSESFSGEKDLFETINSAWDTWSLSGIKEGVNGLLPSYIIWGFFGILILYYLRR